MKTIKYHSPFELSFAHPTDSGIDIYADSVSLLVITPLKSIEFGLARPYFDHYIDSCGNKPSDELKAKIKKIINDNIKKFIIQYKDVIHCPHIINAHLVYSTGTRFILPELIDMMAYCKSGKYLKYPLLGQLQNGVGVIDEGYRGVVKFIYDLQPSVIKDLQDALQGNDVSLNKYIDKFADLIPNPLSNAIGQLVPPRCMGPYQLERIDVWEDWMEDTDRGVTGFGGSNR